MFINKNSIIIDGVNMGQYITEAKFGYNKLWSSDSGRNLAGTMVATLVGVYPKIVLEFRKLTKSELEIVAPILDRPFQNTTYYDPNKKQNVTMRTYTGDYEVSNKGVVGTEGLKNESFNCSFIAISKRV